MKSADAIHFITIRIENRSFPPEHHVWFGERGEITAGEELFCAVSVFLLKTLLLEWEINLYSS